MRPLVKFGKENFRVKSLKVQTRLREFLKCRGLYTLFATGAIQISKILPWKLFWPHSQNSIQSTIYFDLYSYWPSMASSQICHEPLYCQKFKSSNTTAIFSENHSFLYPVCPKKPKNSDQNFFRTRNFFRSEIFFGPKF